MGGVGDCEFVQRADCERERGGRSVWLGRQRDDPGAERAGALGLLQGVLLTVTKHISTPLRAIVILL